MILNLTAGSLGVSPKSFGFNKAKDTWKVRECSASRKMLSRVAADSQGCSLSPLQGLFKEPDNCARQPEAHTPEAQQRQQERAWQERALQKGAVRNSGEQACLVGAIFLNSCLNSLDISLNTYANKCTFIQENLLKFCKKSQSM